MIDEQQMIECPPGLMPNGVDGAWADLGVLRAAAWAHNRHPFDHEISVKAWVVLYLLHRVEGLEATLRLAKRCLPADHRKLSVGEACGEDACLVCFAEQTIDAVLPTPEQPDQTTLEEGRG